MKESSLFDVLGCFDKYLLVVPVFNFCVQGLKLDLYGSSTACAGRKEFSHDNFLRAPAGISALKLTRAKARSYYLFIYYFKLRPSGFDHGGSILDHFQ